MLGMETQVSAETTYLHLSCRQLFLQIAKQSYFVMISFSLRLQY